MMLDDAMVGMWIPLTQGYHTLVDKDDVEQLLPYKWMAKKCYKSFYAVANPPMRNSKRGKQIYMHRLLLGLYDAPYTVKVDHVNHNTLDNRRCNIRVGNDRLNSANQVKRADSKQPYKCVRFQSDVGKWKAHITVNYATHHLGWFATAEEAARAYDKAAYETWGEWAHLNFPAGPNLADQEGLCSKTA